jgi:hypothetical protein
MNCPAIGLHVNFRRFPAIPDSPAVIPNSGNGIPRGCIDPIHACCAFRARSARWLQPNRRTSISNRRHHRTPYVFAATQRRGSSHVSPLGNLQANPGTPATSRRRLFAAGDRARTAPVRPEFMCTAGARNRPQVNWQNAGAGLGGYLSDSDYSATTRMGRYFIPPTTRPSVRLGVPDKVSEAKRGINSSKKIRISNFARCMPKQWWPP